MSPRTAAAWSRLPEIGVESVVVTARPPRWLHALEAVVGDHGVAICANGAFVYDVPGRTVRQAHPIEHAQVLEIAEVLRGSFPGIGFMAELATGVHMEPDYPGADTEWLPEVGVEWLPDGSVRAPVEELDPNAVVGKLLARREVLDDERFVSAVSRVLGDRAVVAQSHHGGPAEISAPGVTKASGLQHWCDSLGIDATEVWAFGDMPNDLPMLRWAGTSYAMANGHPDVIAAADRLCDSNAEDGVARVLETLQPGSGGSAQADDARSRP
ncbi:hydrolase [Flexivirga endophytica]|uniref:Hydrolase n=1 Tax=Flexivirga endophytica TaxID=1849103 RepID=A0A916SVQ9_9MICO|nr:hydrolase [Flexivirga endophytica]GHB39438.1 hydrolase [Flexivirga endophytica]